MNNFFSTEIQPPFEIKFISNFYDYPLKGYGYNNDYQNYYEFNCEVFDNETVLYHFNIIKGLSLLRWRLRQWLFEQCFGNHWSPGKKQTIVLSKNSWKFKLYYKVLNYV